MSAAHSFSLSVLILRSSLETAALKLLCCTSNSVFREYRSITLVLLTGEIKRVISPSSACWRTNFPSSVEPRLTGLSTACSRTGRPTAFNYSRMKDSRLQLCLNSNFPRLPFHSKEAKRNFNRLLNCFINRHVILSSLDHLGKCRRGCQSLAAVWDAVLAQTESSSWANKQRLHSHLWYFHDEPK